MTKKHRNWRVKARVEKKLPSYVSKRSRAYLLDLAKRLHKKQLSVMDVMIDKNMCGALIKMYGNQPADFFEVMGVVESKPDPRKAWIEKRMEGGIFARQAYLSKYPITLKEAFPDAKPYTDLKWPD